VGAGARLRESGVTIILTTHYIEEAEEMADRIGVISKGEIILVEEKAELMRKLGKKQLTLQLQSRWRRCRRSGGLQLELAKDGNELVYTYDTKASAPASPPCCRIWAPPASASRTCDTSRARSRTSSSAW
jgi:ABC-type multidrug transport system ATPase subunit